MLRRLAVPVLALAVAACCAEGSAGPDKTTTPAKSEAPKAPAVPTETPAPPRRPAKGQETWGASHITWRPSKEGFAEAKKAGKPIALVVYATWCPHCTNYSAVFEDQRVAAMAQEFVMIRVDQDKEPDVAGSYAPGVTYVPRTFFLRPDGVPTEVKARNPRYPYFYDEADPEALLDGMRKARLEVAAK